MGDAEGAESSIAGPETDPSVKEGEEPDNGGMVAMVALL
jgi:hypothetical protein